MAFAGLRGLFWGGVVHHPDPRVSARGLFIFRRCMVRHLLFLLLLDSQTLSQISRRVCFASNSLGMPGTLTRSIPGVPCPPFRHLPLPRFFLGGLLHLCWAFLGTLSWHVTGLLPRAFLEHSGRCLGGPYFHHCPPTCLIHHLGVLPASGFYFWCHLRS